MLFEMKKFIQVIHWCYKKNVLIQNCIGDGDKEGHSLNVL